MALPALLAMAADACRAQATPFPADYKFDWFSGTGTAIFIAALVTLLVLGLRPRLGGPRQRCGDQQHPQYIHGLQCLHRFPSG